MTQIIYAITMPCGRRKSKKTQWMSGQKSSQKSPLCTVALSKSKVKVCTIKEQKPEPDHNSIQKFTPE